MAEIKTKRFDGESWVTLKDHEAHVASVLAQFKKCVYCGQIIVLVNDVWMDGADNDDCPPPFKSRHFPSSKK